MGMDVFHGLCLGAQLLLDLNCENPLTRLAGGSASVSSQLFAEPPLLTDCQVVAALRSEPIILQSCLLIRTDKFPALEGKRDELVNEGFCG